MLIVENELNRAIEYFNPTLTVSTEKYVDSFTHLGIEVEEVRPIWLSSGPIVIGQVVEIVELTDFKKPIRLCQVQIGENETTQIICGARNFSLHDKVVVALPGAILPGDFKIAARKTYDHDSNGMMCSAKELGLGFEGEGIITLPDNVGEIGDAAVTALDLTGNIFDLTPTPDRGYLLSYRGILRDLSLVLDYDFIDEKYLAYLQNISAVSVNADMNITADNNIYNSSAINSLILDFIENINNQLVTPWQVQKTLALSGIELSNVTLDLVNYVILTLGEPILAYAIETQANNLQIEELKTATSFETINKQKINLQEKDLVFTEGEKVIGIAGIIQNIDTKITTSTSKIVLESGVYNSAKISKTARRMNLATETSKRFERGVDTNFSVEAINFLNSLLEKYAGAKVSKTVQKTTITPLVEVAYDFDFYQKVVGVKVEPARQKTILTKLGLHTAADAAVLNKFIIPSWRNDLHLPIDLVEEIVRVVGYADIVPELPIRKFPVDYANPLPFNYAVENSLAAAGLIQVLTSPFMNPGDLEVLEFSAQDFRNNYVAISNPLEKEVNAYTSTLLPSILHIAKRNLDRGNKDLAIFSIAKVGFAKETSGIAPILHVAEPISPQKQVEIEKFVPEQQTNLVALFTGRKNNKSPYASEEYYDVFDAIEVIKTLGNLTKNTYDIANMSLAPLHSGRSAVVYLQGELVGQLGQLHPRIAKNWKLPENIYVLEINISELVRADKAISPVIPDFPAVMQDLSITLDSSIPANEVIDILRENTNGLLSKLELYDLYTGNPVPEGKKSLTFALNFQAADRTLTEEEATEIKNQALAVLENRLGAEIRGKGTF